MVPEFSELVATERRIAAFGLPISDASSVPVSDERWPAVGLVLAARSLTGLALAAAEEGWLRISDEATADLVDRHRAQMMQTLSLERILLSVGATFDRRGVPFVVLKGPALAHSLYPDPSWRPFGDLDLLVRTQDWRTACAILAELGFRRELPEPAAGFDERFGKAATHMGPDGQQLDLHRALVLGPFGIWIRPEQLFDEVTTFHLGGRTFQRLTDTALLLHAAVHASLGWAEPLPIPLRDVAQIALTGDLDREHLRALVREWRLAAVLEDSFAAVEQQFGVTLSDQVIEAQGLRPTKRERRVLAGYRKSRGVGGVPLSMVTAVPGVRNKVAYVRSLVMPSRDFMVARAGGDASYPARWRIPMRWITQRMMRRNR